jgi:trehalose 6-phosphate synthase
MRRDTTERKNNGRRVIVLANRAPFRHDHAADGSTVVSRTASGLVTALEPLVERCRGTWVAYGAGSADLSVAGFRGGINVPAAKPAYRLRYVSVPEDEHRGHYYGFANEGLWPLCHDVEVQPIFRADDFRMYEAVNRRFAAAVREEAGTDSPVVLVQDYHFALVPRALRQRSSSAAVMTFWHIPWPRPRVLGQCPWAAELLDGLLGSDVIGVQTEDDRLNFLGCAAALLDARVNLMESTISYRGHSTRIATYPVGVEWGGQVVRNTPAAAVCRDDVFRELGLQTDVRLGVGVDRLDYTKGIAHKFLAIEKLLEERPELRGRFVFAQVAEPSRDCIGAYQAARREIVETADRINQRFGTDTYRPIHLMESHCDSAEVYRLYRAADLCYVGSLHDGMNLVAKEFVAARDDDRGVLVLSDRAGAARQLRAAVRINPYQVDRAADALGQALDMTAVEQAMRMRLLRANVEAFSAGWWTQQLLDAASVDGAAVLRGARHTHS